MKPFDIGKEGKGFGGSMNERVLYWILCASNVRFLKQNIVLLSNIKSFIK